VFGAAAHAGDENGPDLGQKAARLRIRIEQIIAWRTRSRGSTKSGVESQQADF
jgi:hypothetical protein